MAIKRAKTLADDDISATIAHIERHSDQPLRDRLYVLLSVWAGMRAQEVAMICAEDVLDSRGRLKDTVFVSSRGAKYGQERTIPMRTELREGLEAFLDQHRPERNRGPLFVNQFGRPVSSDAVQKTLRRAYDVVNLEGCSSHSGRRTFGTRVARKAAQYGGTLRDAQYLLGHSNVTTTEAYVEFTPRQRELIDAL